MNTAHWHLVLNHFPIIGTMVTGFFLTIAIINKNKGMIVSSYCILFFLSIIAFIVNQTGEGAEEAVESLAEINKWALHEHEEFAETSIIIHIVTGVMALIGFILTMVKKVASRLMSVVILLSTYITIGFMSYTGYLGGQIRHTEVNGKTQTDQRNNINNEPSSEEDD